MLPATDPTDAAHLIISQVHADLFAAVEAADCAERCQQLAERLDFSVRVLTALREAATEKAERLQR